MRSRRDQVLRLNFNGSRFIREQHGVGNFDLIERAYSSEDSNFGLFLQQNGPIGRRFVLNTRLSIFGNDSTTRSAVEAPTIIVNDAFTSGGAQRRGGTHGAQLLAQFGSRLRARHSLDAHRRRGAGRTVPDGFRQQLSRHLHLREPRRRSRRAGRAVTPGASAIRRSRYRNMQARLLHPGRHQGPQGTHDHRRRAIRSADPRAGQAEFRAEGRLHLGAVQERQDHAPRQLGHVLRLAVDRHLCADAADRRLPPARGQHHQSVVSRPGSESASTPPTNRYLLAEDRAMAYSQRLSAGIAQTLSRRISANVLYSYGYRYSLLTGRNLNAPVGGVRPDPDFANVMLASPDGRGTQHYVNASANINLAPMAPTGGGPRRGGGGPVMIGGGGGGPMMIMMGGPAADRRRAAARGSSWRRGLVDFRLLQLGRRTTTTPTAPFAFPPASILANEWGPAKFDRRHNGHFSITSSALRNFTARLGFNGIVGAAADHPDRLRRQRRSGVQRSARRRRPELRADAGPGTRRRTSPMRSRSGRSRSRRAAACRSWAGPPA